MTHHHPVHRGHSQTQFQYTSTADRWAGQSVSQKKIIGSLLIQEIIIVCHGSILGLHLHLPSTRGTFKYTLQFKASRYFTLVDEPTGISSGSYPSYLPISQDYWHGCCRTELVLSKFTCTSCHVDPRPVHVLS